MSLKTDDLGGKDVYEINAFAGTENLTDALANWQAERDEFAALGRRYERLEKVQAGLWDIVHLAQRAFTMMEQSGSAMFLPPKIFSLIGSVPAKVEGVQKLEKELQDLIKKAD